MDEWNVTRSFVTRPRWDRVDYPYYMAVTSTLNVPVIGWSWSVKIDQPDAPKGRRNRGRNLARIGRGWALLPNAARAKAVRSAAAAKAAAPRQVVTEPPGPSEPPPPDLGQF